MEFLFSVPKNKKFKSKVLITSGLLGDIGVIFYPVSGNIDPAA